MLLVELKVSSRQRLLRPICISITVLANEFKIVYFTIAVEVGLILCSILKTFPLFYLDFIYKKNNSFFLKTRTFLQLKS